jgi:NAD(P)-dependent dehydrogenase (short-subunit alcohol dehydrogenase family)
MLTTLITGANRGIGLALANHHKALGHNVIATARNPENASALQALGVCVEPLEVDNDASVRALSHRLEGTPIHRVVNNAGVFPDHGKDLFAIDADATAACLRTNCVGPLLVARALVENLKAAGNGQIINISSGMGSIARAKGTAKDSYAYRASKAALNMLTVLLAEAMKPRGITCVAHHPGWVKTDMGGQGAALDPQDSARRMTEVWNRLTINDSGRFLDTDGADLPW